MKVASPQSPEELLEEALVATCPTEAVLTLAVHLRDAGMTQAELYELYSARLQKLRDDDGLCAALEDSLDCIWGGGWGQGRDLFAEALSDDQLQRWRVQ